MKKNSEENKKKKRKKAKNAQRCYEICMKYVSSMYNQERNRLWYSQGQNKPEVSKRKDYPPFMSTWKVI